MGVGQAWDGLKKRLRLMVPDEPERAEYADPSYAYGGYAPVSLRLVSAAVAPAACRSSQLAR